MAPDWVITESVSEQSSQLPVKKKDGEVRWCVDFRQVNDQIVSDSFPIAHIEELVQKTAGKKILQPWIALQPTIT